LERPFEMSRPTLLLIDVRQAFDDRRWGQRNNPDAEQKIARLLSTWREYRAPIITSATPRGRLVPIDATGPLAGGPVSGGGCGRA
jgi:hypothetical protein